MAKQYRVKAVQEAVQIWDRSDWFTASELYDVVRECIRQPRGGITPQGVSRILTILEARGELVSERHHAGKKYMSTFEGAV
jgi:hypothetical protein